MRFAPVCFGLFFFLVWFLWMSFWFFFLCQLFPAEYGVDDVFFFRRCHCPDAGVPVGIDLAHIWALRGGEV